MKSVSEVSQFLRIDPWQFLITLWPNTENRARWVSDTPTAPLWASELADTANLSLGGESGQELDCSEESECTDTERADGKKQDEVADEATGYDELFHAMYLEQEEEISNESNLLGESRVSWTCAVCNQAITTCMIHI